MTTIGDIVKILDGVHQGDFVLRLTEGLQGDRRQQTLQQYVVTPQLVQCFDQALSLIGGAVTGNSSKGAYMHGSFGSGKTIPTKGRNQRRSAQRYVPCRSSRKT